MQSKMAIGEKNRELLKQLNAVSTRLNEFYEKQRGIKVSSTVPAPFSILNRFDS